MTKNKILISIYWIAIKILTDKCSLVQCKNGGKCEIENGEAICTCSDEYTGNLCEIGKCKFL